MDVNTVLSQYIELWNARDPEVRQHLIEQTFAPDLTYVDPLASVQGSEGLQQLVAGVQQQFPGFQFSLLEPIDVHHQQVRFRWQLGPGPGEAVVEGTDVATLTPEGKLQTVIGFLDRVPATSQAG